MAMITITREYRIRAAIVPSTHGLLAIHKAIHSDPTLPSNAHALTHVPTGLLFGWGERKRLEAMALDLIAIADLRRFRSTKHKTAARAITNGPAIVRALREKYGVRYEEVGR